MAFEAEPAFEGVVDGLDEPADRFEEVLTEGYAWAFRTATGALLLGWC
ncbi:MULTISPECIES: hypothetical protein [unclassified Streptomyces]